MSRKTSKVKPCKQSDRSTLVRLRSQASLATNLGWGREIL